MIIILSKNIIIILINYKKLYNKEYLIYNKNFIRIFAIILRILIIAIWFKILVLSNCTPNTTLFCSWIGFIAIGIYFAIQAIKWPKYLLCPIVYGLKYEAPCKK